LLIALALVLLPIVAGDHHAEAHGAQSSVEHIHSIDPEHCTQDHALDGECAAISSCPVCVVRKQDAGKGASPETFNANFFQPGPVRGNRVTPDTDPPRLSDFA
jgi:hypothetical protein